MVIKDLGSVAKHQMEMEGAKDVLKQMPISSADGTPSYSLRVFNLKPGGHTPYHNHPFEHLNYIISGDGVLVDEQKHEHQISAGNFALILPDEIHQFKNTSDSDELKIICAVPKDYE